MLETQWPPSHTHFFTKGGRVQHILKGMIESAQTFDSIIDEAQRQGGTIVQDNYMDDWSVEQHYHSLPRVPFLDDNFDFVKFLLLGVSDHRH